ncbi:MAG: group II intron maturase-specific domain-containing protein [Bacteroidales bacterium]
MSREVHVRCCEQLGGRFPGLTRLVITVSGPHSKKVWDELAVRWLNEHLIPLGVDLNKEKTQIVDLLKGEAFGFLGFDIRRVKNRQGTDYFILMTPKLKARKAIKSKIQDIIRNGGATPDKVIIAKINEVLAGWVNYFRVGNSSRAFGEVRDYLEMKIQEEAAAEAQCRLAQME